MGVCFFYHKIYNGTMWKSKGWTKNGHKNCVCLWRIICTGDIIYSRVVYQGRAYTPWEESKENTLTGCWHRAIAFLKTSTFICRQVLLSFSLDQCVQPVKHDRIPAVACWSRESNALLKSNTSIAKYCAMNPMILCVMHCML